MKQHIDQLAQAHEKLASNDQDLKLVIHYALKT